MEISTAVNLTDGISKLRIVSMEIIQTGAALKLEGISDFQYTSDTGRGNDKYNLAIITKHGFI